MANPEHLELLKQGVEVWNAWRKDHRGVAGDLSRADLGGMDLTGLNLTKVNLLGADLNGTDLRQVNMMAANLSGVNLSECRLNDADLSGVSLVKAYLLRADLSGVNLSEANLTEANLTEVNLGWAVLIRANLCYAKLKGANLEHVLLGSTILGSTDLTGVTGLDSCGHHGPSVIDHHTLVRSGRLPVVFLRGCGLSDNLIEYMPSLLNDPIQFYSCFISYSHADKSFAHRLHDALQGRGIRCWLDEHQLLPGHDIFEEVDRAVRLWDKVLLCCSKDSLTSWWVDNEVNTAFDKEQKLMKQRGKKILSLIPLNLDGYLFTGPWQGGKATQIKSRLAADFTGWEQDNNRFEEPFERLIKALRADDGREAPPKPKL